ncbi:MAG TPA: hypothetical protein DDW71_02905 [Lactobacillus sp.]|nr:hypothetical protein [Lactobacillus sp.]
MKTWPLYVDIVLQAFKTIVYYVAAVVAIGGVFGIGLLAGYFAAIVSNTSVPSKTAMARTLSNVEGGHRMLPPSAAQVTTFCQASYHS